MAWVDALYFQNGACRIWIVTMVWLDAFYLRTSTLAVGPDVACLRAMLRNTFNIWA